jgi:hypothetical protein
MVTTKVVNYTQKEIVLKEGNGNFYFYQWALKPNESEELSIDISATYKTFLVCFKGEDNTWASLVMNSDYCLEYKQVHVCMMDSAQKMFLNGIPRMSEMIMEKLNIRNDCATNIVLTAVISRGDTDDVATVELAQLAPRKTTRTKVLPRSGHWKYFLRMVNDSNEKIEITDNITTRKKSFVVNFTSSDGLSCVPK